MSSTSPSDLAITFRSIPRRLREAQGDTPPALTETYTTAITRHVAEAAALMRTAAEPSAIADAIAAVPADAWDSATLERLRTLALELGRELRNVAAADPDRDD